ncbi:response regulator transcription factor [Thermomicrobium sp. CFH 73360]|uniref:response regulator n=1 Tax=Thermomicrobium sp. CFH 73360 TaxID=2951987 RepID=UPI002076F9B9|nr:response regulator transcription factor [Thermomicrobium sp. CFH 73360]MCM8745998.1 response regulator transcription factor [Thermomicrobium sp. CFH 73360]
MRVLIVDDHALFRDGLRSLLEARGVTVVGEAGNGREAVELTRQLRPDIVLMDLTMPEVDGLSATRILTTELPEVKVVILTASDDEADLFEAIKSGAYGYLLKNLETEEFFRALEAVQSGQPVLTPHLARRVLQELSRGESRRREEFSLTERERDILELLVQGITSNRELADRLFISENTVKYHLRNIMAKLHLENRAQVIAYALRTGLVRARPNDDPPDERVNAAHF